MNIFRTLALSFTVLVAALTAPARAIEPLPPESRDVFLGSPEDKAAKVLYGVTASQIGRHYVTGNEWNLHLFYPSVKDLGGAYVGVGSDQAYLFIGWQKPDVAFLVDYDPWVIDIHHVYQAFLLTAETPEAFRRLWDKESKADAEKALAANISDKTLLTRATQLLRTYRTKIGERLDKVKAAIVAANVPSFLNDQATYTWVRDFVRVGRARPMLADLLAKKGITGVMEAAAKLQTPVRVFYVSNAEQYWDFSDQYRKNVASIFGDDKSLMVRTLLTWERNQDYRYNVQPVKNYQTWIAKSWVVRLTSMIHYRKDDSKDVEFFVFDGDPSGEEAKLRSQGKLE